MADVAEKKLRDALQIMKNNGDSFDGLRQGTNFVAKKCPLVFNTIPDDEKVKICEIAVKRGMDKPMHKPRSIEIMKNVLMYDGGEAWAKVLQKSAIYEDLKALLADKSDLLEKLTAEPPTPVAVPEPDPTEEDHLEEKEESESEEVAAPAAGGDATKEKPTKPEKVLTIKEKLKMGHAIMKENNWVFPNNPTGTALDGATRGVQLFYEGMTKLTTTSGAKSLGCDIDEALNVFESDFDNMLKFMLSMYGTPGRLTYRARVKFVVVKMKEFCPEFCAAIDRLKKPLPWESKEDFDAKRAAEEKAISDMFGTKPNVVWIDFKSAAFESTSLKDVKQISFKGFHDDESSDLYVPREEWLTYVIDRAGNRDHRVAVVITNKKHMQTVTDIRNFCATSDDIEPPIFIVCTRGTAEEFAEWQIDGRCITTDWNKAAQIALDQVKKEYPNQFVAADTPPCRYGSECRFITRPGGCPYRHEEADIIRARAAKAAATGGYTS